jgi:hypothetical protein
MSVVLRFGGRDYRIAPDMALVADIEGELGGVENLLFRLTNGFWKVSDLVTLIHMMLQAAGRTVDYAELGDLMLKEGLPAYLLQAEGLLKAILGKN